MMAEPVSIQVDAIFDLLNRALMDAVEKNGGAAKAVAWDVTSYFAGEIGHYRTSTTSTKDRSHG